MEGNTNLHNETEKLKNQLKREWKTVIEDNKNLGVKVKQLENEKKQWLIKKNQYEKDKQVGEQQKEELKKSLEERNT